MGGQKPKLSPPRDLTVSSLWLGGESLLVLSYSIAPPVLPAHLSQSEREVLRLLLEGLSNEAIARARGRSKNTIANQIAAIFAKTGVSSRAELASALWNLADERTQEGT